ncbi:MurR/RpiR family transcriptional regulator [Proteiniclasticum sp. BAD-10]|jgi:DNA-binding MurR/RpiR family transcriptional regulator|uniref:MurR/RpiR family transcriptional regulator n=1 Tax=Proteiniclasticum sediminis TaxID=2804028 RepID=A0A941CMS4_9CLOT|nr:MurR/RpiR family transcriptional regulator [Proteiniclasticum sediminis]MBR0574937.1 MurR/RpiR family transcriptional regulator [Proteiniclasticum sediminis]
MEGNRDDLMRIIQSRYPKLSKGQKLIAEFILKHYDKAAFLTAAKLGSSVGVSESTVVRFAIELGYEGYPELQKSLQDLVKVKLTTVQRLELTHNLVDTENALKGVLKADMENIRSTLEKINEKTFDEMINAIFEARNIYIIGLRSSNTLADFLAFYLNLFLENVRSVHQGYSDIFEQMIKLNEKDLVIAIGFPRYSQKTIEALDFAKERKAKVCAITDSLLSPLAARADYSLIAQSNMASFVDSLVAPLSVINAVIVSVGMKKKEQVGEVFGILEEIWAKHDIFN